MVALSVFMYYTDPIRRIQSIGIRVVGYLGRLTEILVQAVNA